MQAALRRAEVAKGACRGRGASLQQRPRGAPDALPLLRGSRRAALACRAAADDEQGPTSSNGAPGAAAEAPSGTPPYALMAALAGAGALETAYLAAAKLAAVDVACPVGGACSSVLNSPYATLLGLPLPLFGAAAYGTVAALAAWGAREAAAGREVAPAARFGLCGGVAALAATSGYLMWVLHSALGGAPCVWCYTSAGLSLGLAAALVGGLSTRQLADAAGPGLGATAATVALLFFGSPPAGSTASDLDLPYAKPEVTAESTPRARALATRLRNAGAHMYGAFWCSHCFQQEQAFGREAMADFPYTECFPEGWRRGVKLDTACAAAGVKAFPTWVIGNQTIEGELDFDTIEAALDALKPAPTTAAP